MRRTGSVRMHTYRGTTNLYTSYDPSEPIPMPKTKFDRIKVLRDQLKSEAQKRKKIEKDLQNMKQAIKQAK